MTTVEKTGRANRNPLCGMSSWHEIPAGALLRFQIAKNSNRPGRGNGRAGPVSPHSTSIAVRDCRAIGRWDSVVKGFSRWRGRFRRRTDHQSCRRGGSEPLGDSQSCAPLFTVALNHSNFGKMTRRRAMVYGVVSCPLARTRSTASKRLVASICRITRRI